MFHAVHSTCIATIEGLLLRVRSLLQKAISVPRCTVRSNSEYSTRRLKVRAKYDSDEWSILITTGTPSTKNLAFAVHELRVPT